MAWPLQKSLSHRDILCDACRSLMVSSGMRSVNCHSPHSTRALPTIVFLIIFFPKLVSQCVFAQRKNSRYPQSSDAFKVPLQKAKARDPGDLDHGGEVSLSPSVEQGTV